MVAVVNLEERSASPSLANLAAAHLWFHPSVSSSYRASDNLCCIAHSSLEIHPLTSCCLCEAGITKACHSQKSPCMHSELQSPQHNAKAIPRWQQGQSGLHNKYCLLFDLSELAGNPPTSNCTRGSGYMGELIRGSGTGRHLLGWLLDKAINASH